VRLSGAKAGFVKFDTRWDVKAPILLTVPFGILAVASISAHSEWTWPRAIGSILVTCTCLACAASGLRGSRILSGRKSGKHSIEAILRAANNDAYIELDRGDPSELATSRFAYVTRLVDARGLRQPLLQTGIATQLNKLRQLKKQYHIDVRAGASLPSVLRHALTEETELQIEGPFDSTLTSRLTDRQLGTAGILLAISLLAMVVVFFLVTGQLEQRGPVTPLGVWLGALLVLAPLITGIHLGLGGVRVHNQDGQLRIEHRQGLFGTKKNDIPLSDIEGIWRIQGGDTGVHELLLLEKGVFRSVPVTQSAWPNWQAVFRQSE
jgi:hypothetical protein